DTEPLRYRNGFDQTGKLLAWLTDREGPRHVRPIAVDDRPEVDHHEITASDHAIGRLGMWHRRVRARGDDRVEGGSLSPALAHCELELGGELRLGRALGQSLLDIRERLVGDGASGRDPRLLSFILHDSEALDDPGC